MGVVVLVVAAATATWLAVRPAATPSPPAPVTPTTHPVTRAMLVTGAQARSLLPGRGWKVLTTSDNTTGTGLSSVCQRTRFADPRGRGTLVRRLIAAHGPRRTLVETVEVSRSARASAAAYRTTLGWFAACGQARVQLLDTYRVAGLRSTARLVRLRLPDAAGSDYVVGVARTGTLTVSVVLEDAGSPRVSVPSAVATLRAAVYGVCHADPAGRCPAAVRASPVLPPPSGETPGTLAATDLPAMGGVRHPWVGTRPGPARPNLAATTCDRADFVRSGARGARQRTFLIPQAQLPRRFGITETYGSFGSSRRASAFVTTIARAMATCEHRDLGATVSRHAMQVHGPGGSSYELWRLDSEIAPHQSVGFWMGVARVGGYVAQVNLTPAGPLDVDPATFESLVGRARDRLFELGGPR